MINKFLDRALLVGVICLTGAVMHLTINIEAVADTMYERATIEFREMQQRSCEQVALEEECVFILGE